MEQSATFWMQQPLRKYAVFDGRARRAEYWWFALGYFIVLVVASILDGVLGLKFGMSGLVGPFYCLVGLAAFLPSLGVSIRRLHDLDKSGWWLLVAFVPLIGAIILLVWYCSRGTVGTNRFGPDPLAGEVSS